MSKTLFFLLVLVKQRLWCWLTPFSLLMERIMILKGFDLMARYCTPSLFFVAPECSCRASRDVRINYTADKHLLPLTLVCALVLPRSRFFLSQTKGNFRLVLIFCSVCVYHVVIKVQYYNYSNSWVHSVSSRFWQNLKHHSFVLLVHRHETHKRTFSFK